jgi:pimeloyl-ACP methyl ester carboxylesterase
MKTKCVLLHAHLLQEISSMTFIQRWHRFTIVASILGASAASADAQPPATANSVTAAAPASIAARPFQVRVEGTGPPMILIPGLMCDGTVWNQTVDHFKSRYQCHVLSLAGFAGTPPVAGAFIPTMRDAIVQYISANHMQKPVIIGHSLGGHLALAVAIAAPQAVGPIVVVDGAPALGVLMSPAASAQAIAAQSAAMTNAIAGMAPAAFAMQNRFMIAQMVQSPKTAEWLAQAAGRSDVKTVARAMNEVTTADLRDACARIQTPVLLIGAAEFAKDAAARQAVRNRYEEQVARIPHHQLAMLYDSRHFVMLDKAEAFYDLVDKFLVPAQ